MSFSLLIACIKREVGDEAAERVATRVCLEMEGMRVKIPRRPPLDRKRIAEMPGTPAEIAKQLGVHRTTISRLIR